MHTISQEIDVNRKENDEEVHGESFKDVKCLNVLLSTFEQEVMDQEGVEYEELDQALVEGIEDKELHQAFAEGIEDKILNQALAEGIEVKLMDQAPAEEIEVKLMDQAPAEEIEDIDLDQVLAEVQQIRLQEGLSDEQEDFRAEPVITVEADLERKAKSFRRSNSSSAITSRSTYSNRSKRGFEAERIRTVPRKETAVENVCRPSIYTQQILQSPHAIHSFRQFRDKTLKRNHVPMKKRIEELALPKESSSGRKYATDDDTRHCHFQARSRRRRHIKTETADPTDCKENHFVARMESMERNRQKKIGHARGENEYNDILDKKMCPQCGMKQSYAESRDKKKLCQSCGVMFRREHVWSDVEQSFLMRVQKYSQKKEDQRRRVL
ncbi:unnamed protein product [Albugo candida]|uniref:Uncharacterized protein n=1 Tax=Albugo candida TaxID=65357 RepID=A0A024G3U7_9STRA|nr:unnamed protein product [Albugo candida]|eukprot:CCI40979.1 unnamed protein product [Albugo candida]